MILDNKQIFMYSIIGYCLSIYGNIIEYAYAVIKAVCFTPAVICILDPDMFTVRYIECQLSGIFMKSLSKISSYLIWQLIILIPCIVIKRNTDISALRNIVPYLKAALGNSVFIISKLFKPCISRVIPYPITVRISIIYSTAYFFPAVPYKTILPLDSGRNPDILYSVSETAVTEADASTVSIGLVSSRT